MRLRGRLDKLEYAHPKREISVGAKDELHRRFERADPETKARVLSAIKGRRDA